MKKIETEKAPQAIGPYSQGIVVEAGNSLVFVSGQLPVDPVTGKLIEGDIAVLTHRVLDNVEAVLLAAGSSFEKVLRTEIFLTNFKSDYAAMNAVYGQRFHFTDTPARQTVEVSTLPLGARIEISCIAVI